MKGVIPEEQHVVKRGCVLRGRMGVKIQGGRLRTAEEQGCTKEKATEGEQCFEREL